MQIFQRRQVRGYVLAHRRVWTAARLDGPDPLSRQRVVPGEELGVFPDEGKELSVMRSMMGDDGAGHLPRKDIIRDGSNRITIP